MRRLLCPILWLALTAIAWSVDSANGQCLPGSQCPSGSCATPWAPTRPRVQAQKFPQVVQVTADEGGGVWSLGTGVIVSRAEGRAYVATCEHNIGDRIGKVLVTAGGKTYEAVVGGEEAGPDAALLVIQDPGIRPIGLGPVPAYGARTYIGGFTRRVLVWAGGVLCKVLNAPGHLKVSGTASGGWSGGPMIDSKGRLIGILWGTVGGQTYGTPIAVYRRLFCRVVPAWRLPGQAPGGYAAQPSCPSAPSPNQPVPGNADLQAILTLIAELQTEVKSLQAAVEALATQQPAAGPPGPQGPQGPPGLAGGNEWDLLVQRVAKAEERAEAATLAAQQATGAGESARRTAELAKQAADQAKQAADQVDRKLGDLEIRVTSVEQRSVSVEEAITSGRLKFRLHFDQSGNVSRLEPLQKE